MYVYIYIYIYTYVCVYIYTYIYTYTYVYVYICCMSRPPTQAPAAPDGPSGGAGLLYRAVPGAEYIPTYIHIHVYTYVYVYIYIYTRIYYNTRTRAPCRFQLTVSRCLSRCPSLSPSPCLSVSLRYRSLRFSMPLDDAIELVHVQYMHLFTLVRMKHAGIARHRR